MIGSLQTVPALSRPELLGKPVLTAIASLEPAVSDKIHVASIDPTLADTAEFCEAYDVGLDASANCVIVAGRRGDITRYAAAVILATTLTAVNTAVRKRLDARRASFAPMDDAVAATGMEYGGITPIGLPEQWPVLVDPAVIATPLVVIGSGVRYSKLVLPGALLAMMPRSEILNGLAIG